jgi:hypothetical protein
MVNKSLDLFNAFTINMPVMSKLINYTDLYSVMVLDAVNPLRKQLEFRLYTELYIKMHREQLLNLLEEKVND